MAKFYDNDHQITLPQNLVQISVKSIIPDINYLEYYSQGHVHVSSLS